MDKLICSKCGEYKNISEFSKCKLAKKRNGYSYVCKKCQAKDQSRRRKKHLLIDALDAILKKRLYDAQNRAKSKNMFFDIDIDFMYYLWQKQNGKCALTGIPMTTTKHGRRNTNISIDRIDSTKGYTKENVQLVCSAINFMKANMDNSTFLYFCKEVIDYTSKNKNNL